MQLKATCMELTEKDELLVEVIYGNGKALTIRKNLSKGEAKYLRKVVKEKADAKSSD